MSVTKAIQLESASAIEASISIPFEFKNVPEGKNPGNCIIIKPITVRTWFRLKPYLVLIEKKDIDLLSAKEGVVFDSELNDIISKYDEFLFEIICIGIHNSKGDMPKWFKEVLIDSCTWEDVYILLNAIIFRIGTTSFSNSITALKNVSPLDEEEIIALQKNKEAWILKTASLS